MASSTDKPLSARQRILKAAARVYLARGPAATIEEIAAEAEYSPGALYKHFAGKDAIFRELSDEITQLFVKTFAEPPPVELSFEQHLKWVLYRLVEMTEKERDMFIAAIMTSAASFASSDMGRHAANRDQIEEAFVAIMQQGIDEGVLRDDDPRLFATGFMGMLQAVNMRWIERGPYPIKPHIDAMFELFLRGAGTA